jgi:uncharacterized membrane protein YesL
MTQKMMDGVNVIVILFLMNILWLIGVVFGLIILGLVPSTAALIHVMQLPKLFSEGYSYKQLTVIFLKEYQRVIKMYHWRVLISPILLLIFYYDVLIIQSNSLMKALFQWPIILMMGYIVLIIINYFVLENNYKKESISKKIKFSLVVPLIFPIQSFCCFLLFVSFFVISMMHSWFSFLSIPTFFYVVSHLFIITFKKKGMVTF